ncbi:MAG: cytochrome c-type biogenesis protein CcmH [Vicinamibacteraceae bacterium]|nr:cytochrome c-type biogenesis protein CcmH [Vicinamibacteraceae bacterium]
MLRALVLILALATPAAPKLPPEQEALAKKLEAQLIAPCCWSQQVSVHQSPAAEEIKQDLRKRIARGETEQEILDAYVTQFGTGILVVPPAEGYNILLYVIPPIVLVLSAGLVIVLVKRFTKQRDAMTPTPAVAGAGGAPDRYVRRLEEELSDLD